MSWIVQNLLRNRTSIKGKGDFESDEFLDLLMIEKTIEILHKGGLLTDYELSLIDFMSDGKPLKDAEVKFNRSRISISKHFIKLCNKIAFYLGGYFTDDGYLEYMRRKYKLTDSDVSRLRRFIRSKYKNKIMRRRNTVESNKNST